MKKDELIRIMKNEGDEQEFLYRGFMCCAMRGPCKQWNGYVQIPVNHPCYGLHYDDINVGVHGGLTFGDDVAPWNSLIKGHFIGFDCAHVGDLTPHSCLNFDRYMGVYRTKDYVIAEIKHLVDQLIDMEVIENG